MSVQYKDYYQILGLSRNVGEQEIKAAYRKLAKKYHPDVNKTPGGEKRYREINEAYEVLRDPEKRRLYDELGPTWQNRRDQGRSGPFAGYGNYGNFSGDMGDFSDFFRTIFGSMGMGMDMGAGAAPKSETERDLSLEITLEDALNAPIRRKILIQDSRGRRSMEVKLPRGITDGSRLSLKSDGGNMRITVKIARDPRFQVQGHDILTAVPVSPWEAALGMDALPVQTPLGPVAIKLPQCTQPGQKLRIKGRGLPLRDGGNGDLYARVEISFPRSLTEKEKELLTELRHVSEFNPRGQRP